MTATQSSTYENDVNKFGAGNCIDGNTDSDRGPDGRFAICHTNGDATPWVAIDYGTSVTVQRVEIFNRGYGRGRELENVDIRISNELPSSGSEMFSGGTLFGQFAGPGTDRQHIIISGKRQL